MKQRYHMAPKLPPGTVVVLLNGEVIAQGDASDPACIAAVSTDDADIYMSADVATAFSDFQAAEAARRRRMN